MSDHPSDDDENWFARERARTTRDSQRTGAAQRLTLINGGLDESAHADYMSLLKKREDQRKQDMHDNAVRAEEVRKLIIAIKESHDPESEEQIKRRLTVLGHPDVRGLVQAIVSRRTSAPQSRARKDKGL